MNFLPLLTILFIGLQLCEVIDWSWWLIFLPLYVPVIAFPFILLIVSIFNIENIKQVNRR